MTDSYVDEIRSMQGKLDIVLEEKKELEDNIKYLKLQLPRLYYVEANGNFGYTSGIVFVGGYNGACNYVETVMGLDHDYKTNERARKNDWAQIYPHGTHDERAIAGYIKFCHQFHDIWQEIYELSLKVKS